MHNNRLAAFDMDGTLINGRLVFALADRFDLSDKVRKIQASVTLGHNQTKAIAALFAGLTKKDVETAVESIPLVRNCKKAVETLRERGYRMGIISDSYTVAARRVAERLQMEFVAANELEIIDGKVTGKVDMPFGWEKIGCFCKISVCKRYHLEKFAKESEVPIENTIAVGDTKSDICMIRRAGIGIAFSPKDDQIADATSRIVQDSDLSKILEFIK